MVSIPAALSAAARPGPTPLMNWISVEGVVGGTTLLCVVGAAFYGMESRKVSESQSLRERSSMKLCDFETLRLVEDRLHRDQPDLQQIAVVQGHRDAGG